MKKLILFLLISFFGTQIFAQCQPDYILLSFYDEDVKDLALRRINMFNHPDKKKVEIPQIWQDSIWKSLAAIYNTTSILQRDTVFNRYCIHHESPSNTQMLHDISVTTTWTYDPITFALQTNDPILDAFLANHGVIFGYSTVFNGKNLKLTRPINAQALVDSLIILGVSSAFVETYIGDGNKINYRKEGNVEFFDFSLRWGDCLAGCISAYTWKYKVEANCFVTFLETVFDSGGGSAPAPTDCNISTIIIDPAPIFEAFYVYPNPVLSTLSIPAFSKKEGNVALNMFDFTGKLVFSKKINGQETFEVEVGNLAKGLYFIELSDPNAKKIAKFVKS
jgi:Secretion system C-terminal sorting domain